MRAVSLCSPGYPRSPCRFGLMTSASRGWTDAAAGSTMDGKFGGIVRGAIRLPALLTVLVLTGSVATAQDYTGNVNPSAWSGPTVMQGAIDAQARRNGALRSHRNATRAQANACAQKARLRAEHGAGNPQVARLYRLCRGIGR